MDQRSLRNVLGCFATGVAILTTRTRSGEHAAVTVNSFSSVSLDPPLVLFSLAKNANVLQHFQHSKRFLVNILSHNQESLSNMFARPSSANWKDIQFVEAENGCALFPNSVAQLECDLHLEIEGGDHRIFFGKIVRLHLNDANDPLLFYRGRYGAYMRSQWDKVAVQDGTLSDFSIGGWG